MTAHELASGRIVILAPRMTSYRASHCRPLKGMLESFRALPGYVFRADKGFDAEYNFRRVYELLMRPIIKQRVTQKGPKGKGHKRLRYRSRVAKEFDSSVYRWRSMMEAIFRTEESDEHNLRTRFRNKKNRKR